MVYTSSQQQYNLSYIILTEHDMTRHFSLRLVITSSIITATGPTSISRPTSSHSVRFSILTTIMENVGFREQTRRVTPSRSSLDENRRRVSGGETLHSCPSPLECCSCHELVSCFIRCPSQCTLVAEVTRPFPGVC